VQCGWRRMANCCRFRSPSMVGGIHGCFCSRWRVSDILGMRCPCSHWPAVCFPYSVAAALNHFPFPSAPHSATLPTNYQFIPPRPWLLFPSQTCQNKSWRRLRLATPPSSVLFASTKLTSIASSQDPQPEFVALWSLQFAFDIRPGRLLALQ
jgi:hypothetical protein